MLTSFSLTKLTAQRTFETGHNVIYENVEKHKINLGVGFNPIMTAEGKVAFIRGRRYGYGDTFDCSQTESKNWIVIYDPVSKQEKTIFDRPLDYDRYESLLFCVFEQMQLSHDGSTLYLVSPVYATSGSLAIINLARGSVIYVSGVDLVYVIDTGSHRDELIYQQRITRKSVEAGAAYPVYPFIHAAADGKQIAEISDEWFSAEGNDKVPLLRAYLRKIGGTITVNGKRLP